MSSNISVVVPTYQRSEQIGPLLETFVQQTIPPAEIIIVDGAPPDDTRTEAVVRQIALDYPIPVRYIRSDRRGTSIQRNIGIERAVHEFVALIDDDIRIQPDFFEEILNVFEEDVEQLVGGIAGHRVNLYKPMSDLGRWRWYKRLRLFSTYEPGRYDFLSGYPINQNLHPPFEGTREVDFITTACAVWRKAVFASGLRFNESLKGYAVVEDALFSMQAGRKWKLLQCGSARCTELRASGGRVGRRELGYKKAYNYRFLFVTVVPQRTWRQELRFWYVQCVLALQLVLGTLWRRDPGGFSELLGRLHGAWDALRITMPQEGS